MAGIFSRLSPLIGVAQTASLSGGGCRGFCRLGDQPIQEVPCFAINCIGIPIAPAYRQECPMDDARIASEMTLDGIAQRLEKIQSDVAALQTNMTGMKADMTDMKADMTDMKADMTGMKADMTGMKADMTGMKADMETVKADMKTGFNDSKVRDEELRSLMTFGLEAREALRESVEARFDATDQKHDEEIGLLKDVLRAVRPSP